jgi:hypothetical protein
MTLSRILFHTFFFRSVLFIHCVLLVFCPHATYFFTTQTSLPLAGFEPAMPASELPQTLALDCLASGSGESNPLPFRL